MRTTHYLLRHVLPLVGLGLMLLFVSNWQRFGSWQEFGHRLNFTGTGLMFTSRFDSPFENVSVLAAGKELMGSTFFVRVIKGFEVYRDQVVAGLVIIKIIPCWVYVRFFFFV
jgi:hypothetical protein